MATDLEADLIKKHEGYRDRIYLDTVGVPTGGYGHAFLQGSHLPHYIWEKVFWFDHYNAVQDYEAIGFKLNAPRKAAVVNMLFNLGITKFKKFKNMIAAIRAGDWETASREMLNSKWACQVGPARSEELAKMLKTGLWPHEVV